MMTDTDYAKLYRHGVITLAKQGYQEADARDYAQDAMILAVRDYDPERGSFGHYFMRRCFWAAGVASAASSRMVVVESIDAMGEEGKMVGYTAQGFRQLSLRDEIEFLLSGFPERTRDALMMWSQGYYQEEIGEKYQLSRVWVAKIIGEAIRKIRRRAKRSN